MVYKVLVVFLSVVTFQSFSALTHSPKRKLDMYVDQTIKSLENAADFYAKNFDKVNLDSIYGLRIAQGALKNILRTVHHDNSHFQRLNALHTTIKNSAEKALPYLKDYQLDYYNEFKPIIDKQWKIFEDFKRMKTDREKFAEEENIIIGRRFNEKISDKCMSEMTGTNALSNNACYVSLDCLKLMTDDKLKGYGNTHQVVYFLLGFQTGCRRVIEKEFLRFSWYLKKRDVSSVDEFLEKKCQQIFVEMNELKGNVVANGQTDLFMEQGLVCGMLGYEDFFQRDILENVFTWQDEEYGCFGKFKEYHATHFISRMTMRKILYERTLENGCSSHETGVATGFLSIYLRWLILRTPELE